jgi:hypothetical protein
MGDTERRGKERKWEKVSELILDMFGVRGGKHFPCSKRENTQQDKRLSEGNILQTS